MPKAAENNASPPLILPCRAGFVQFDVRQGDVDHNLRTVREALAAMAPSGPGLVVLPELWASGFAYDRLAEFAARTPDLLKELAALAGRYGVLLAGSLPETAGDSIHNTLYLVDGEGILGSCRKQQLFVPMAEDLHFIPGCQPAPMESPLGLLGGLVCYDLRFAELAKTQAAAGAGLLIVSAQWPSSRLNHWRVLLQARAIENQFFVVACNRCGQTLDTGFGGHSMVIAPDGEILAEAGDGPEQRQVPIDPERINAARRRFNTAAVVTHRQEDIDKVVGLERLRVLVARYKAAGRRIVFTNGCFDILHKGHVTYLEQARREGDCLIVGLNSDSSVRRQGKGDDRPINDEASRARVLAALGCVDHVVLFEEDTPISLITALMPHVLVKGGDWTPDKIVGAPEVRAAGGTVKSIPVVADFSTTNLLAKVRAGKK